MGAANWITDISMAAFVEERRRGRRRKGTRGRRRNYNHSESTRQRGNGTKKDYEKSRNIVITESTDRY